MKALCPPEQSSILGSSQLAPTQLIAAQIVDATMLPAFMCPMFNNYLNSRLKDFNIFVPKFSSPLEGLVSFG
jgi:hypothetical protein